MEHLKIDVWDIASRFQNQASSTYEMILVAAIKARKIAQDRNKLDIKDGKLNKYTMKPINQALSDISEEV